MFNRDYCDTEPATMTLEHDPPPPPRDLTPFEGWLLVIVYAVCGLLLALLARQLGPPVWRVLKELLI